MKINQIHSHLRKDALQIFRNKNTSKKLTLEKVIIKFRRKYVGPQSQTSAEHKRHKLTCDANMKLISIFIEELYECAERYFRPLAQQTIDTFLYAKIPHISDGQST